MSKSSPWSGIGFQYTTFWKLVLHSWNESVSPFTARKGWPVPWPAGSVSAYNAQKKKRGQTSFANVQTRIRRGRAGMEA